MNSWECHILIEMLSTDDAIYSCPLTNDDLGLVLDIGSQSGAKDIESPRDWHHGE